MVQENSRKDIFNANKRALFCYILPDKTIVVKDESCHDSKLSKLQLTMLFYFNSDGAEKLMLLVIGKKKNYLKNTK